MSMYLVFGEVSCESEDAAVWVVKFTNHNIEIELAMDYACLLNVLLCDVPLSVNANITALSFEKLGIMPILTS